MSVLANAFIAALVLGVAESLSTTFVSSVWADMVAYLFLIVTLVFFPQGLFGARRERV